PTTPSPTLELLDSASLTATASIDALRTQVRSMFERLAGAFAAGAPVAALVRARSDAVDRIMQLAWQRHLDGVDVALIAVGGYGRAELHPASDIDILVLCVHEPDAALTRRLE